MLIMLNNRTVRLDKETINEIWVEGVEVVYTLIAEPEEVYTFYTAKDIAQAEVIYSKITEGWCKNWPECLLQEQTA